MTLSRCSATEVHGKSLRNGIDTGVTIAEVLGSVTVPVTTAEIFLDTEINRLGRKPTQLVQW